MAGQVDQNVEVVTVDALRQSGVIVATDVAPTAGMMAQFVRRVVVLESGAVAKDLVARRVQVAQQRQQEEAGRTAAERL